MAVLPHLKVHFQRLIRNVTAALFGKIEFKQLYIIARDHLVVKRHGKRIYAFFSVEYGIRRLKHAAFRKRV